MTEARDRRRSVYQVLLITLWLTLLVLAVKVWAGLATRSLSLLAESLHTLIDSFSTLLSLIAISSLPYRQTGRELWSHSRRETAGLFLLLAFLGFSGFTLLVMAMQQLQSLSLGLISPLMPSVTPPLIQLLGLVVAVNICLVLFERYQSRHLESQALWFNANHMLKDAWLTVLVLLGLVAVSQGVTWLDPVMAIALVLLAVRSVWRMVNWQLPLLVQQTAIAPEALTQLATQVEGVLQCHCIRSKGLVGRYVFVEMVLVLHPEFVGSARSISDQVEANLRDRYGAIHARIRIHGSTHNSSLPPPSLKPLHPKIKRSHPDWN